jgi:hypothetical protein
MARHPIRHVSHDEEEVEERKPPPPAELPAIGSMVAFYSQPGSSHSTSNTQPCIAIVAGHGTEGTVNLLVIETGGSTDNRSNVVVMKDGATAPDSDFVMPIGGTPAKKEEAA